MKKHIRTFNLSFGTKIDRKFLSLIVKTYNMPILGCVKVSLGLKVHKIEIFFGFNFEICIISLLVMSKY